MNYKIILPLVVVVIIAGAFYLMRMDAPLPSADAPTEQSTAPVSASKSASRGTFADLFAKKGNFLCSFSMEKNGASIAGSVRSSAERVRADFDVSFPLLKDQKIQTHVIRDNGFAYVWSNASPQGTKVKSTNDDFQKSLGESLDTQQQFDYTCEDWKVDPSVFILPSNITFIEAKQ